jgi:hypothetical protein
VSFSEDQEGGGGRDVPFRPSYEVFTPHARNYERVAYRTLDKRVPTAVAPPSSVSRPNYHDALRRVSVVVYQHLATCERRLKRMQREKVQMEALNGRGDPALSPTLTPNCSGVPNAFSAGRVASTESGPGVVSHPFDPVKANLFDQKRFVSPQYRYIFAGGGMRTGLPMAGYALSEEHAEPRTPTVDEILSFMRTLFNKACLSSECSLVCLIYVERLMEIARVPLLASTWKPITLCGLLLASKVWQDLSSWNVEFSMVYPEFGLKQINHLENTFLQQIRWDLYISSSLYAKYYFALRSLAEKQDFRRRYNYVVQIDAPHSNLIAERSEVVKEAAKLLSKSL